MIFFSNSIICNLPNDLTNCVFYFLSITWHKLIIHIWYLCRIVNDLIDINYFTKITTTERNKTYNNHKCI